MKFLNDSTVCAKLNKYIALTAAIMRTLWNNPEQTTVHVGFFFYKFLFNAKLENF